MQVKRPLTPKHTKSLFPDFLKEDVTSSYDNETAAFTGISTTGISQYTSLSKGILKDLKVFKVKTSKRLFKQPKVNMKTRRITLLMT